MALEFGFYDSYEGDRKYTAQNMNDIFEGLITEGVYSGVGDEFAVKPGTGLQVTVGTGRAWFKMTWNKNEVVVPMELDKSDPVYGRIDTICIRAKKSVADRENDFYIYKGTIQTTPSAPVIVDEESTYYLPLANVTIRPNATDIKASDIEILVGRKRCPYVTSIVQQTDITKLFEGWDEAFHNWWNAIKTELENLDVSEVLVKLQEMVDKRDKATEVDLTPPSSDKWMTPAMTDKMIQNAASEFEGGVTSFNGRTGAIEPEAGDYTSEDVGALPLTGGTLTGDLEIGAISDPKKATIRGDAYFGSEVAIHGKAALSGDLIVGGIDQTVHLGSNDTYPVKEFKVWGPTTLNGTMAVRDATTFQNILTVQNGTSAYGGKIRFYDDSVMISEPSNGRMELKATSLNLSLSGSAGAANTNFLINGANPFANLGGITYDQSVTGTITPTSGATKWSNNITVPSGTLFLLCAVYGGDEYGGSIILPWDYVKNTSVEYTVGDQGNYNQILYVTGRNNIIQVGVTDPDRGTYSYVVSYFS